MNIRSTTILSLILAAAIGLVAVGPADAGSIMLSDGNTTLVITDEDFFDEDGFHPADESDIGTPGVVMFMGTLGSWTFTLTSGISMPALGSATEPDLELHNISLSSSAGGTLTIWFSEEGFGPSGPVAESVIGGVAGGKVTFQTFQGVSLFEETNPPLASTTHNAGVFGSTTTTVLPSSTGPYSLTQKVTITHKGAGTTGFDSGLSVASVPDGGMTLSLLGLALMGLAGFGHRFSKPRD